MKRLDPAKPFSIERGTQCFYLCNNGYHVFKTPSNSEENQREIEWLLSALNDAQAFDTLVEFLIDQLPMELKIKKLMGVRTQDLLEGFYIVPKSAWHSRKIEEVADAH